MGWDCTFHLVDPKAVTKVVRLLLKGKPPPEEFLAAYETGAKLWAEAHKRVLNDEPADAAQIACQLAIYTSAAQLPHTSARNIAFSFGEMPEPGRRDGPWIRDTWTSSPEAMFKPLLKQRPELEGTFRTAFESNSDTGVFIPAKHCADAAELVVQARAGSKSELLSQGYTELERALRAAHRHGLAFWEATDLGVAQTNAEMLNYAFESFSDVLDEGTRDALIPAIRLYDGHVFVRTDDRCEMFRAESPDKREKCSLFPYEGASRAKDGRWMLSVGHSMTDGIAAIFVAEPSDATGGPSERRVDIADVGGEGDELCGNLVCQKRITSTSFKWLTGDRLVAVEMPEPTRKRHRKRLPKGCARLGNGTPVAIYDGHACEVVDGKVNARWDLHIRVGDSYWAFGAWGNDGLYFTHKKHLYRTKRDAKPEPMAKLSDWSSGIFEFPSGEIFVNHQRDYNKLGAPLKHAATMLNLATGELRTFSEADLGGSKFAPLGIANGVMWGSYGFSSKGGRGLFTVSASTLWKGGRPGKVKAPPAIG